MPNEENTIQLVECDCCNADCSSDNLSDREYENYNEVCNDCHRDNFRYSERTELYIHTDDWNSEEHEYNDYDEDDENRDEYVSYYSKRVNSNVFRMPYEKPYENILTLGIEIEVQIRESSNLSRNDIAYNLQYNVFDNFVICKEDASIGYGFEIVSSPATFDYHKYIWSNFFNSDEINCLKSFKDSSTGLHIHVGQNFLSRLAVGKILYFINCEQNEKFLDEISGRKMTSYCVRDKKLKIKDVNRYRDRGAFNIYVEHSPTHEFRLFNGNIKKESFYKCLEFVVALCHYAKNECSLINPNYLDFISYVRANHFEYPYLVNWLLNKKYLKNIKHKTKFYDKKKVRNICA
jgi:hypothetical protein